MSDTKVVTFHDETLRDGPQSLWGILASKRGVWEALAPYLEQAGFFSTTIFPVLGIGNYPAHFQSDPWEFFKMTADHYQTTPLMTTQLGMMLNTMQPPVSPSLFKYYCHINAKTYGKKLQYANLFACTRDEITREFPVSFPAFRAYGIEPIPYIVYQVSPKRSDDYYARTVKEVATKYKPVRICLKDVGGLLTPERAKTLIPAMINNANGIPIELHSHGNSGFHEAVCVEAMKLGIRRFHTCVPPLANGTSMPSVYNVAHNARVLGLKPDINEEPLRVVEERITKIAKEEGYALGVPRLYDERIYQHKVPGGVIANLEYQLKQLGLHHRLDEILDEITQVVADLGYPAQITPHSQFIVTQATMNVSLGKRYETFLDSMTEYAMGIYGTEDTGLDIMDQNLKDKFLGGPNAKRIAERWARQLEENEKEYTFEELKTNYGVPGATDEEFWNHYWGYTDKVKDAYHAGPPHKSYYFGKEPLVVLLNELKKDHDISRLELRKGNNVFHFRSK